MAKIESFLTFEFLFFLELNTENLIYGHFFNTINSLFEKKTN